MVRARHAGISRVNRRWWLLLTVCLAACVVSTGPEGGTAQNEVVDGGVHCRNHIQLQVRGVTCPSCREVVAASLLSVDGVISASVTLTPAVADVVYCDDVSPDQLTSAVKAAGYGASLAN